MKFAHYIKIGPRPLFAAQCLAGLVCSTFSIGIRYYYNQKQGNTSNWSIFNNTKFGRTLLNDYVPFFNGTNINNRDLLWAFLVGAFLPIPSWILSHFPRFSWLRKVHWPLIFVTLGWMPSIVPAGALFTWLSIGFFVYFAFGQFHWRQRHVYLLSAALDLGLNITLILITIIFYNNQISFPSWWGNPANATSDSCRKAVLIE
jgi:hypothetical protein